MAKNRFLNPAAEQWMGNWFINKKSPAKFVQYTRTEKYFCSIQLNSIRHRSPAVIEEKDIN